MHRIVLLCAVATVLLALATAGASAATFASRAVFQSANATIVPAEFRYWGRRPVWYPWSQPACQFGYYFACRRGPYGYGACACWPY